ncbi:hypothetical protein SBRCBS47491_005991 [Sporothrix bragantina]|uniref:N-acetyltransferase ESCO zinc-finger domain-containing protein n=1 Tax=Sporothrix bragantina TaxID=671064 RepID=A0ABP0C1A6_9PEZI
MRYMTPDTPGTRSLESPVTMRTEKGDGAMAMKTMATTMPSKMETTTPSATPTPTPSPTKAPETGAARKPARRAIRTYGKKRPLLEDTSKGNILSQPSVLEQPTKRQKITAAQETTIKKSSAAETTNLPPPDAAELDIDEISRQLLKEAEEAELRNRERPQTPRKSSPQMPNLPPRKAGDCPRKQGIMHTRQEGDEVETVDKEDKVDVPKTILTSMMAASSSRMRLQLGLSKAGPAATMAAKKKKKAAGIPSVQTTLSLAIAGGDSASVKECKECNILYNTLHEKDAKFHARYHASVCRKQQK